MFSNSYQAVIANDDSLPGQFYPGLAELHDLADAQKRPEPAIDFSVDNHGSIIILTPLTDLAEDWVAEHISQDALAWGSKGVVVEPRYIGDIVSGIVDAGFSVTGCAL